MSNIIDICDAFLAQINEIRRTADVPELQLAPYDHNECNFYYELRPINASEAASCDITNLSNVVNELLHTWLSESEEERAILLSSAATNLATWSDQDEDLIIIKWRVMNRYIDLDPVGPLIDGSLVLQGTTISPEFGPCLCRVEFAADHEEEFTEVAKIMPWEMLITISDSPNDGNRFVVPISLGPDTEGTVRVLIFIDRIGSIPYDEENAENFNSNTSNMIPAIMYANRVSSEDSRILNIKEDEGHMIRSEEGPRFATAVSLVYSQADRQMREAQGYETTAVSINNDGVTICDSSSWPFNLCVAFAPVEEASFGLEDLIFVESDETLPTEYEFIGEVSSTGNGPSISLACKLGPTPQYFRVLFFICAEEGLDVVEHYVEHVTDMLGGGIFRLAPMSVSQAFGAHVGIILITGSNSKTQAMSPNDHITSIDINTRDDTASNNMRHLMNQDTIVMDNNDTILMDDKINTEPFEKFIKSTDGNDYDPHIQMESASFGDISDDEFEEEDGIAAAEAIIDKLMKEKFDLEDDLLRARAANADIQKKAAIVLAKAGKDGTTGTTAPRVSSEGETIEGTGTILDGQAEKERHYKETMELISECNKRMKREQGEYEQQALDLQTRLDDKEFKAEEIAASLRQFKREILTKAENSRTGKGVSQRLIKQFEHAESKKDEDLEKVRLRNISLKTTLRKLEKLLRSREQLAEGLHMIDFEQLKIENQTWNEKIEERNEELAKLKRKKTATVQVLTHVREKIRFIDNANDELRGVLGTTERDIVDSRNRVTFCKHDRDHAKEVNVDLKAQRGFATSDLLIMDFEQRKAIMDNLNATLRDLHDRQFLLTKQINKDTDLLQTMRTVSAGRSGTLRTSAGKKATIGVTAMF